MRRILVVGPSWVGDTVLAQPLFKLLHERHAGLALDVLDPPGGRGDRRRLGHALAMEGHGQASVLPNTFKSALVPFFAGIRTRTGYLGELRHWIVNDGRSLDKERLPQMAQRYA